MWLLLLALSGLADAYETDQLTDRHIPLADSLVPANQHANGLFDQAVERANKRTQCQANFKRTRRVLAKQIFKQTSPRTWVGSRGFFRASGYSAYAAWMETSEDVERRPFLRPRDDIYSSLTLWHSVVLTIAGTNSTFNLGGVLLGSDKPDHFFYQGYDYWRGSRHGKMPLRGIRRGTATERTIYGMFTSKTFSYADLRANWDGYMFYVRLLEDGSEFEVAADGCVEQVRDFDWREWVSWEWDEVLNPGIHTRLVQRGLSRHLERNRAAYCSSYKAWGQDDYPRHITQVLGGRYRYVDGGPPRRVDPYGLEALCGTSQ